MVAHFIPVFSKRQKLKYIHRSGQIGDRSVIFYDVAYSLIGVPGPMGAAIANKIASAGAQASQVPLPGRLPLPAVSLHQAINQAFVDALHGSFLISGIALLAVALLVGFLFQQKQRATKTSAEHAEEDVTIGDSAEQQQAATVDVEERSMSLIV